MENVKCIGVDWSGDKKNSGQRNRIWVAIAQSGSLIRLENGLTRDEVIALLEKEVGSGGPLVIGLDFAFSFPEWYLTRFTLGSVHELWCRAANHGDEWLAGKPFPFWGGKGHKKPEALKSNRELEFRQTDKDHSDSRPKSVFQLLGNGAVGTGTIRGMLALIRLQKAGAAIWPFDVPKPDKPCVVEIFPWVFYGNDVRKGPSDSGRDSRKKLLESCYGNLGQHWKDAMIKSDDAFDAGVSALFMSARSEELLRLPRLKHPRKLLEGEIWSPR